MASWTGRGFWGGLLFVWLLHASVVLYVLPPRFVFSEQPILFADYTYNLRSCLLYLRLGNDAAQWAYDPYQMAGYPANTRDAAGNHAGEVFVDVVGRNHPVSAFKIWIMLGFLAFPLLVGVGFAAFGFEEDMVVAGVWAAALAWSIDPTFRLFREFGGFTFVLAVGLCFAASGTLWAWLQSEGWWRAVLLGLTTALAIWVHVGSLAVLGLSSLVMALARPPGTSWRRLGTAIAVGALGFSTALVWIIPTQDNLRWLSDSAQRLGASGFTELWATLTLAPERRFGGLLLWMGLAGGVLLARRTPRLGWTLQAPALVWLILVFVPMPWWKGLTQFQPQRLSLAASVWLLPGAVGLAFWLLRRLSRGARFAVVTPVVAIATAFQLLPWLQVAFAAPRRVASLADRAKLPHDVGLLIRWLRSLPPGGQVLLEDMDTMANASYHRTYIGGLLPFLVDRPVLGGPEGLPFQQQVVDLTDGVWLGVRFAGLSPNALRERLDRYAVAWVVAVRPDTIAYLRGLPDLVTPSDRWAGLATFAVRNPQPLATGGAVLELGLGRIGVRNAREKSTLIRLHWHHRVRTVPALPVARVHFDDDPVGLIRVANGSVCNFELRFD